MLDGGEEWNEMGHFPSNGRFFQIEAQEEKGLCTAESYSVDTSSIDFSSRL